MKQPPGCTSSVREGRRNQRQSAGSYNSPPSRALELPPRASNAHFIFASITGSPTFGSPGPWAGFERNLPFNLQSLPAPLPPCFSCPRWLPKSTLTGSPGFVYISLPSMTFSSTTLIWMPPRPPRTGAGALAGNDAGTVADAAGITAQLMLAGWPPKQNRNARFNRRRRPRDRWPAKWGRQRGKALPGPSALRPEEEMVSTAWQNPQKVRICFAGSFGNRCA